MASESMVQFGLWHQMAKQLRDERSTSYARLKLLTRHPAWVASYTPYLDLIARLDPMGLYRLVILNMS